MMILWLLLGQNSSTNSEYMSSFTVGITPSLLLVFVAALGFLMLWVVAKHAWAADHNSNNNHDTNDESCDEERQPN